MPIAIVGMSCRFSGDVNTPEKLWQMCADARDTWSGIPKERFNLKGFHHPEAGKMGTTNARGGHFLVEDLSLFDAAFFNFPTEVANAMDPQLRLQLETVYEAIENAGITLPKIAGSSTSVFSAVSFRDYHDIVMQDTDNIPRSSLTGNGGAMFSNRISHFFDLRGPSMSLDTGCSGGLAALHLACQSLRSGEAEMSIVGGSNLLLNPQTFITLSNLGLLGDEGKSYSFDSRASGYGRGEGVCSILLKTLADALRDGDPIQAVIRETAVNQDGRTSTITSPAQNAQGELIRTCYSLAGLDPVDTSYVEAHGTGTIAGDSTELSAIGTVFGERRLSDNPLYIGSVKANLGHLECASGLAAVIKVAMMLDQGRIPPCANFELPSPAIDFKSLKLKVPIKLKTWPSHKPRRASINNFGYGGTNVHVVMESGLYYQKRPSMMVSFGSDHRFHLSGVADTLIANSPFHDKERRHLFLLSAKDQKTVKQMIRNFNKYIRGAGKECRLSDLCYTLTQRRTDFQWRVATSVNTLGELEDAFSDSGLKPMQTLKPPRLGFVFTGQGAQWFGMGRELMTVYPVFLASLQEADHWTKELGASWSLLDELQKNEKTTRVNEPFLSFPLCVAIQISLVILLRSWGIRPVAVTGHSSGEISAAYASGALTFRESMACAYFRGCLCDDLLKRSAIHGGMLALGQGREEAIRYLERISSGKAVVSCVNSPSSVTMSGDLAAIEELEKLAAADNVFARQLKVGAAYHSHHMQPMAEEYQLILSRHLKVKENSISVLFSSPVTGGLLESAQELGPTHWVKNMVQQVLFEDSLREMIIGNNTTQQPNIDMLIEIGPHGALAGPIRQILGLPQLEKFKIPYASCLSRGQDAVKTMHDLACVLKMSGYDVNLGEVNFPIKPNGLQVIHDLPPYPWNHSVGYWYESLYRKEERMREYEPHDFLGTRISGLNVIEPTWRRRLRISEMPWVQDHMIQSQIVYPGSGYVSMAIEALCQISSEKQGSAGGYQLDNMELINALVIPDTPDGIEVQFSLREEADATLSAGIRKKFRVHSLTPDGAFVEHCRGFISTTVAKRKKALQPSLLDKSELACHHLRKFHPMGWYDFLHGHAPTFGPMFRNVQSIQTADTMSLVTFSIPETGPIMPSQHESSFLVHPITLDTAFHATYSAVPQRAMKEAGLAIPAFVKSVYVSSDMKSAPGSSFAMCARVNNQNMQGYDLSMDVVDDDNNGNNTQSSSVLIQVEGMLCRSLGQTLTEDDKPDTMSCLKTIWRPDLSLLLRGDLHKHLAVSRAPTQPGLLSDLKQAVFHISTKLLDSLNEEEESRLQFHHKKLVDWMRHNLASARAAHQRLSAQEADALLENVASQSMNGKMLCHVGKHLRSILRGDIEPLELMRKDNLLDEYYPQVLEVPEALKKVESVTNLFAHAVPRAKVLKIGAGTGGSTTAVLQGFGVDESVPKFAQYDFTDISAGFFDAARSKFGSIDGRMNYVKLDIEKDPVDQSFETGTYDLVVAFSVLHATKNIHRTMQNVRKLLKPNGKLIVVEMTQDQPDVQLVFGTLPGWWLSEEPERSLSPNLTVDSWKAVMQETGFGDFLDIEDWNGRRGDFMSVMMATATAQPKKQRLPGHIAIMLPPDEIIPRSWLDDLSQSIQTAIGVPCSLHSIHDAEVDAKTFIYLGDLAQPTLDRLTSNDFENYKSRAKIAHYTLWVTRGAVINCEVPDSAFVMGFLRTLRAENVGKSFVSLDLDPGSKLGAASDTKGIIDVLQATFHGFPTSDNGTDYEFAERQGNILIPRLCEDVEQNLAMAKEIAEPESEMQPFNQPTKYVQLEARSPGRLDSLIFLEKSAHLLTDDMVEIQPRAFGLNFRDVMVAMGQMDERFMGFECAGIISATGINASHKFKVGDRVCAFMPAGHWSNKVQVSSSCVGHIPDDMTFEVAASIPVVYITAYYSFVEIAQLKKGETVLIHAAAGGVGQAAISIARHLGAEIFVTVGTEEKRKFIQDNYKIPPDHIYSSRDTSFANGVMSMTNGRGVDVVLNSLSGPLLQASWDCIAALGRFIEIGKRDIQQKHQLGMENFARSVAFCAIDLVPLATQKGERISVVLKNVLSMIKDQVINPCVPITTFPISDIQRAFRTMQAGKHIGKIVLTTAGDKLVSVLLSCHKTLFSPESTYLIVGGVGGISTSLAQWMARKGARYIILASRNAETKDRNKFLERLRGIGTMAVARNCDTTDQIDLRRMIQQAKQEFPPIRGVVHAAMVLQEALFENMSYDQWKAGLDPKVKGTLNLHNEFQNPDLEFFITLSSITGILGNVSQANYTAGNTYQDALVNYRAAQGLPGVALDLGIVKSIGAVADQESVTKLLEKMGFAAHEEEEVHQLVQTAIQNPRRTPGSSQLLTGIAPFSSQGDIPWRHEARFAGLFRHETSSESKQRGTSTDNVSLKDALGSMETRTAAVE